MKRGKALVRAALALLILSLAGTTGCLGMVEDFGTQAPKLSHTTHTHAELTSLPAPKGRIPACVYAFRDQTGQYKPQENVSSFSTAVTQGATSMLMQAMKDSGWFVTVEREGLQNLLTERKIRRASLKRDGKDDNDDGLPPLLFARILLQGGITSYETNTVTGGLGARYWGLGGSVMYRQDTVTLHLRAVDIDNGNVLKSVSTSKTILSKEISAGLFRFLTFKKLLEIEGGFTTNEPPQMCVNAAIEKAVMALIIEGVLDGYWQLANPADIKREVIEDYLEETGRTAEGLPGAAPVKSGGEASS